MLRNPFAVGLCLSFALPATALGEATLRGSSTSMVRQNQVAKAQDYTFLRTPGQVSRFVEEGRLARVEGTEDLHVLSSVSYPYARGELQTFLTRLSSQYREACGERLVVTSLTRPLSEQPGNAHPLSVHPAGMAVDLRISQSTACRGWLEGTLLSLERKELLDVTRESRPPHYHVAVFPDRYMAHVDSLMAEEAERLEAAQAVLAAVATPLAPVAAGKPTVASGKAATEPEALGPAAAIVLLAVSVIAGVRRRRGSAGR